MVDGDATYDPTAAPDAVAEMVHHRLDFINIARRTAGPQGYRSGHRIGNASLTALPSALLFGQRIHRHAFGLQAVFAAICKELPALSKGFEIETELTIHALELTMPIAERIATYRQRPTGSISKLSTVRDGLRILRTIVRLTKNERPLAFFGAIGVTLICIAIALGTPLVETFFETGLVPRLPTAVLSAALALMGVQSITAGIILDNVTTSRREAKRIAYLQIPPAVDDEGGMSSK